MKDTCDAPHVVRAAFVGFVLAALASPLLTHPSAAVELSTPTPPSAETMEQGNALYLRNCRLCHGTNGTSGKPLRLNENLRDADYVASVILYGPGYMTGFADHLSDAEIALIATYVRNSWGNAFGEMADEEVAALR